MDFSPAKYDIHLLRGMTWRRRITLADDAGEPINLSLYAFSAELLVFGRQPIALTIDTSNAGSGEIMIATDTDGLAAGSGRWRLDATPPGYPEQRLLYGDVTVDDSL